MSGVVEGASESDTYRLCLYIQDRKSVALYKYCRRTQAPYGLHGITRPAIIGDLVVFIGATFRFLLKKSVNAMKGWEGVKHVQNKGAQPFQQGCSSDFSGS